MAFHLCHPYLPLPDRLLSLARVCKERRYKGNPDHFCVGYTDMSQKALVKAVGLSLVFANWAMALWAIAWVSPWAMHVHG